MTSTHPVIEIRHNAAKSRFEAVVDGELAYARYYLAEGVMQMVQTEVPREIEGRGIAGQLVRAAFDHAAANGLKVLPVCSYVRVWAKRHREVAPLLASP